MTYVEQKLICLAVLDFLTMNSGKATVDEIANYLQSKFHLTMSCSPRTFLTQLGWPVTQEMVSIPQI